MHTVEEKTFHEAGSPIRTDDAQEVSGSSVQETLLRIFQSAPFRSSKQSQQLLQYIVDQTLSGHGEFLKERVIGADVFGRRPDYDTNSDPIVRARAAELRKRLAQFYVGEGSNSAVRIEISPGSYRASFLKAPHPTSGKDESGDLHATLPLTAGPAQYQLAAPQIVVPPLATVPDGKPRRRRLLWAIAALCALALSSSLLLLQPKRPIDEFWEPMISAARPVLIYTGSNPVYLPSTDLMARYRATHALDELDAAGHEFLIPLTQGQKFGAEDLIAVKDTYVTLGDVSANVDVAAFLTQDKRNFDLRSGEDVVFGDLLHSPSILIGAFNNGWTMRMTGDLAFVLGPGLAIRDRSSGGRIWVPLYSSREEVATDYAVVARIPHAKTGEPLIAIAGITQSGTRAAAEFITSPMRIQEVIQSAPKGWQSENMEFVLQTRVVNDIPTTSTVVAVRYW